MPAQVHTILAAALEAGPVHLRAPSAQGSGAGGAAGAEAAPEAEPEAGEESAQEGASTGALSDAALLASSVLASQPPAEVQLPKGASADS